MMVATNHFGKLDAFFHRYWVAGEARVRSVVDVHLSPNITARKILQKGNLVVGCVELTIDLEKGSDFGGFALAKPLIETGVAPPLTESYRLYSGPIKGDAINFKHQSMKTRERFTQRKIGILIPAKTTGLSWSEVNLCACPPHLLHPNIEDNNKRDYILWLCGCCASQFLCACTRGVFEYFAKSQSREHWSMNDTTYRAGICHFCRKIPSTLTYIDPMNGGRIQQHYLPYITGIAITQGVEEREAENIVRERLGIPRIGEGWIGETNLYYTVRALYPEYEIQREASPDWLGKQRLDIYLPEVQVAIEYQGQQHFQPVGLFGGEEGYQRAKQRDREKREKAKAAGVKIVEFKHNEAITEDMLLERLDKAIEQQRCKLKEKAAEEKRKS